MLNVHGRPVLTLKFAILWSLILLLHAMPAQATFQSFDDNADTSPSGRYKVESKSPDNKDSDPEKLRLFQRDFVITCYDNQEKKLLWTHRQGTEADQRRSDAEWASKKAKGEVPPLSYSAPIDAEQPYTLVLTWENARVVKIERISPPVWKSGLTRDEALIP